MGTGIMVLLLVLTVTCLLGCVEGDTHAPCCTHKTVGGVPYLLVKEGDTTNYNCLTNCMYVKEGSPGPLYCFATGDLEVECGDGSVTTDMPGGNCPDERPDFNTPCPASQEGLTCHYGNQTCCGETSPEFVFDCSSGGTWAG